MASIRTFKSEIDYLVSEVISDCYTCLIIKSDKNKENVLGIIGKAVDVRNELIEQVNHPSVDKEDAKAVKKYYKALRINMFDRIDSLFRELSETCKAQ